MIENNFIDTETLNSGQFIPFPHNNFFQDQIFYFKTNPRLTEKILKKYKNNKDNFIDIRNRLAGDVKEEYRISDTKEFVRLIEPTLANSLNTMFGGALEKIKVGPAWINEMKAGDHNPRHDHSGYFSFVWYLDIPEKIRKECVEQIGNTPSRGLIEFDSMITFGVNLINPRTNDLFIFNSGQPHKVYPFKTKGATRISLSGNIHSIKFKDGSELMEQEHWTHPDERKE